ncbi:MAG TPA: hypothetical protein DDY27_15155 [Hyphomonadaceae bacterium]|nr:hypothetical protein [Hyphomonadaceae bacterium]
MGHSSVKREWGGSGGKILIVFHYTFHNDPFGYGAVLEGARLPWDKIEDWREELETKLMEMDVLDDQENASSTDKLRDFEYLGGGVLAVSENAWSLIKRVVAPHCWVSEDLKAKGKKKFRCIFPSTAVNVFDEKTSEFTRNAWGTINTVKKWVFLNEVEDLPPIFRVMMPDESGPRMSIDLFLSEEFLSFCKGAGLKGLDHLQPI